MYVKEGRTLWLRNIVVDARALALGPIDMRTHPLRSPLAQYGRNDGHPSGQRKGIEAMSNSNWVFGRTCEADERLVENEGEDARFGYHLVQLPDSENSPVQDGLSTDYHSRR